MAIETPYRGATFRSRLEARWAAMFDLLGWRWVYEPWDGNHYIPDFVILGHHPMLVEVKPGLTLDELARHATHVEAGIRGHWDHDYLILGASAVFPETTYSGPSIGWLGERAPDDYVTDTGGRWFTDAGVWKVCCGAVESPRGEKSCGALTVCSDTGSFTSRPCGHYHGGTIPEPKADSIEALWNKAHAMTRWVGR